jgi:hypothetical protein
MASVSYSVTFGKVDFKPEDYTVGANGPSVGDVEVRINTANVPTLKDLRIALEMLINRIDDQRYGPSDLGVL